VRAAASEIEGIGKRLTADHPATNKERGFHVERAGQVNPGIRKLVVVFFALLLGVSALVLCTACANVANLLLARVASRQKEIATRLAIGAGRGRLIRQLLTESVMLALLGGICGYALAQIGAGAIGSSRLPIAMPINLSISLDYRVLLFCTALAMVTGVVFGLVPALRATRPDLVGGLKDDGGRFGGSRRFGLRNILVIAQVGICMVLLVCSGLFLRSLDSARDMDTGMANRNLLLVSFDPGLNRCGSCTHAARLDGVLSSATAASVRRDARCVRSGARRAFARVPCTAWHIAQVVPSNTRRPSAIVASDGSGGVARCAASHRAYASGGSATTSRPIHACW